jgi:type VI secretion system protein ImpA
LTERFALDDFRGAVSAELPSGPNLEYDSRFQELLRLAEGTREQQYGSTIIAAKPPEWQTMRPLLAELGTETRDLRVGVLLVESAAHFDGFAGLAEGLALLQQWVAEHWETLHPELDPEDDYDPFVRINALSRLSEEGRLPKQIRTIPLVEAPPHTRIHWGDIEVLRSGPSDSLTPRLTASEIEAALLAAPVEQLRQTYEACQSGLQSLRGLLETLRHQVGETGWDPTLLRTRLRDCSEVLKQHLRARMSIADSALEQVSGGARESGDTAAAAEWDADEPDGSAGMSEIRSREHAGEVLRSVIEYFERYEPSSPVPLLIRRARRLINQGFVEILRDVAPDGLTQIETLAGELDDS